MPTDEGHKEGVSAEASFTELEKLLVQQENTNAKITIQESHKSVNILESRAQVLRNTLKGLEAQATRKKRFTATKEEEKNIVLLARLENSDNPLELIISETSDRILIG